MANLIDSLVEKLRLGGLPDAPVGIHEQLPPIVEGDLFVLSASATNKRNLQPNKKSCCGVCFGLKKSNKQEMLKFLCLQVNQCCGSGSAFFASWNQIRIRVKSWILIRIRIKVKIQGFYLEDPNGAVEGRGRSQWKRSG